MLHFFCLLAMISYFESFLSDTNHVEPLIDIMGHHKPLIMNHVELLSTIIEDHGPS